MAGTIVFFGCARLGKIRSQRCGKRIFFGFVWYWLHGGGCGQCVRKRVGLRDEKRNELVTGEENIYFLSLFYLFLLPQTVSFII